jgi:hypothetical protein
MTYETVLDLIELGAAKESTQGLPSDSFEDNTKQEA